MPSKRVIEKHFSCYLDKKNLKKNKLGPKQIKIREAKKLRAKSCLQSNPNSV